MTANAKLLPCPTCKRSSAPAEGERLATHTCHRCGFARSWSTLPAQGEALDFSVDLPRITEIAIHLAGLEDDELLKVAYGDLHIVAVAMAKAISAERRRQGTWKRVARAPGEGGPQSLETSTTRPGTGRTYPPSGFGSTGGAPDGT